MLRLTILLRSLGPYFVVASLGLSIGFNGITTTSMSRDVDAHNRPHHEAPTVVATKVVQASSKGVTLPTPVFLLSLPKSGTTNVWKYFVCGGAIAANHYAKNQTSHKFKIGVCMSDNVKKHHRPLLEGCGEYDVWTDIGAIFDLRNPQCFYPSVHALDRLYNDYPNATIVHSIRNATSWTKSILQWNGIRGNMERFCDGFPNAPSTVEDWEQFYRKHTNTVRSFAQAHPSLTYIEVQLESNETGAILQEATTIDASCWGHVKPPDPLKKLKERRRKEWLERKKKQRDEKKTLEEKPRKG